MKTFSSAPVSYDIDDGDNDGDDDGDGGFAGYPWMTLVFAPM